MSNFNRMIKVLTSAGDETPIPKNPIDQVEVLNSDFYRHHGLHSHAKLIDKAREYTLDSKRSPEARQESHNALLKIYNDVAKGGEDHKQFAKGVLHLARHTHFGDEPIFMTKKHVEDLKKDPSQHGMEHRISQTHSRFNWK